MPPSVPWVTRLLDLVRKFWAAALVILALISVIESETRTVIGPWRFSSLGGRFWLERQDRDWDAKSGRVGKPL